MVMKYDFSGADTISMTRFNYCFWHNPMRSSSREGRFGLAALWLWFVTYCVVVSTNCAMAQITLTANAWIIFPHLRRNRTRHHLKGRNVLRLQLPPLLNTNSKWILCLLKYFYIFFTNLKWVFQIWSIEWVWITTSSRTELSKVNKSII